MAPYRPYTADFSEPFGQLRKAFCIPQNFDTASGHILWLLEVQPESRIKWTGVWARPTGRVYDTRGWDYVQRRMVGLLASTGRRGGLSGATEEMSRELHLE